MATVPTFNPQGPRTFNFANLANGVGDFSGFFAQADAMRASADLFARQAKIIGAFEDERVQQEAFAAGLAAGIDPGFNPQDIPTGITIADKAFRQGAVDSYIAAQEADIDIKLTELKSQYADSPILFRENAQRYIDGSTSQMPAIVAAPLRLSMTRQANSAYISISKSKIQSDREFHEQEMQDALDFAIAQYEQLPAGHEQEKEYMARIDRLYEQGAQSKMKFATPSGKAMRLHETAIKKTTNALTEMAVNGGVPTGIAIAQGTTGIPEIDNQPMSVRLAALSASQQVHNAQNNLEDRARAREARITEQIRSTAAANVLRNPDSPEVQADIDFLYESATTTADVQFAQKMEEFRESENRSKFLQSDPLKLANLKLEVTLGRSTQAQVYGLIGNGISVDDGLAQIQRIEQINTSVVNSSEMSLLERQFDEMLPSSNTDPMAAILGMVSAEETTTRQGNAEAKLAFFNRLTERVLNGEITTKEQLLTEGQAQLQEIRNTLNTQQNLNVSPAERAIETKIQNDPSIRDHIELVRQRASMLHNTKGVPKQQAFGQALSGALQSGEVPESSKNFVYFKLKKEFGIE